MENIQTEKCLIELIYLKSHKNLNELNHFNSTWHSTEKGRILNLNNLPKN